MKLKIGSALSAKNSLNMWCVVTILKDTFGFIVGFRTLLTPKGVNSCLLLHLIFRQSAHNHSHCIILTQEPLSKTPDFYAANDRMTDTIRGPLLVAQREVAALDIRRRVLLEKVRQNDDAERGAYTKATNWQESLQNTAKKAGFISHHAKLRTELSMVEVQIKDFKQVFGLELFQIFVDLEDKESWLPTVRDIRSIYDQTRRDIEKIHARRKEKEAELCKLGGAPLTSLEASQDSRVENNIDPTTPSYFAQVAAAESGPASSSNYETNTAGPASYVSLGGPLPYSVPGVPVAATSSSTATLPQYPDPFSTTSAVASPQPAALPQQTFGYAATRSPLQQTPYVDPFASASVSTNNGLIGSQPNMGTGGSLVAPALYDPFSSFILSAPPVRNDPFGTALAQPQQKYDPFASVDSGSLRRHTADNPLFRY